jgi:hypothetical protein
LSQYKTAASHIEKINGTPAEYKAGLERAIANGWLALHESGTFVKFAEASAARLT